MDTKELRAKALPSAWELVAPDGGRYILSAQGDQQPQGWAKASPLYSEADFLSLLEDLERTRSSNEAMRKALEDLCGIMEHCSVTSGVCGCGEDMANHSEWSGHSPTDYGSYVAEMAYQAARAALSSPKGKEQ